MRSNLVALAIVAVGVIGIATLQPGLAKNVHKVRQRDDVFFLPPPAQLRAMTLGYRAAAADFLWAKLILEYGLHWQEHRPFPDVNRYIDGILAVEPDFPTLYGFVDTILCYSPTGGTEQDARAARRYLERGTRERPYDPNVWLHYGQFVAFLGPSYLKDEQEIEAWRTDGAIAIAHAVELGADPDRSLAASTILSKAGKHDAAVKHLQRVYAMADDPETRRQISFKLQKLNADFEAEQAVTVFERDWKAYYPHLTRGQALLVGPHRKASACAGPLSYDQARCPADWTDAVEHPR
jgi:hypothetical protein